MKALLVLIGSIIFPTIGYYLDWRQARKNRQLAKKNAEK